MNFILSMGTQFMDAFGLRSIYLGYIGACLSVALVGLAIAQFRK